LEKGTPVPDGVYYHTNTPPHQHTATVAGAQRQSAKVKCKSEGALRRSAKVKWKSDVCREAAPIIPQIAEKVK